jgi:hypothetical protein
MARREIAGADLAEALARRAAVNDVDRLARERRAAAAPLEEASDISLVRLHLRKVSRVCPAGLRVRLHRRHDLPAGQPRPLAESTRAAKERDRSNRHETELSHLRPELCAAISTQAYMGHT